MVLQGKKVGVGLEAHSAVVDADGVGVLVVEEGAGMAVGAATLITSVQRQTNNKQGDKRRERRRQEGRLVTEDDTFPSSVLAKLVSSHWLPLVIFTTHHLRCCIYRYMI